MSLGWTPEERTWAGEVGAFKPQVPTFEQYWQPQAAAFEQYWKPQAVPALETALSGQAPYEVGPEWARRYYEQTVRPAHEEEYADALARVRAAYAGPGTYWGSARAQAEAKLAGDSARELAGRRAQLMYNEELARRQATENAQTRALQAIPQAFVPQQLALQAEGLRAGLTQQELARRGQEALQAEELRARYPLEAERLRLGALREGLGARERVGALSRTIGEAPLREALQRWTSGEEVGGVAAPYYSPYLGLAQQYLKYDPYYIMGGMTQPQPSPWTGLLTGLGQEAGRGFAQYLPTLLKSFGLD